MPNIVSSAYTFSTQADGRQQVHEVHTDLVGLTHTVDYLAGAQDNLAANMAIHATNLGNDLQNNEIATNITLLETMGAQAKPTEVYSTTAQNSAALVAAWPTMSNSAAIFVGEYLNGLSLATLEAVFGWSPTQASAISTTYLQPYAAMAASIRAAQGGLI